MKSNLGNLYYANPRKALVTDDYCQSFGEGRGCMYWNGKECKDLGRLSDEDFQKWYSSMKKQLRNLGYSILEEW